MALLLVGSMAVLCVLSAVWLWVVFWLIRHKLSYLTPIALLFVVLPLFFIFTDVPIIGTYFQPGSVLRKHFGAYLLLNFLMLGILPLINWFLVMTSTSKK
jgi:hypothetical protein